MSEKPRRKSKPKSVTVEEAGVRVRIFKKRGGYWLDVWNGPTRKRVPAKATDLEVAKTNAKALAKEIAIQQLVGVTTDSILLGVLFRAYHEHKGRTLNGQHKLAAERRQRDFVAAWGEALPVASISQTTVDAYSAYRRAEHIAKQRAAHDARVALVTAKAAKRGRKAPKEPVPTFSPLRDGALDPDFRWLSSVFNWAMRHKLPNGKRLLTYNALHDCTWPKEQNIRRPIASHERYVATLAVADRVDAQGRFRLALVLARYTARRIDAILHLRSSDVLRNKASVRAALADAGQDERLAELMKHGAIRWRKEHDKQGVERITPVSETVRKELDRYLSGSKAIGESWLFPADAKPSEPGKDREPEPLSRSTATNWLNKAERLAELPKLRGGLWHAYRRLWATERKALPDVDVAEAGGWTGTKAMKLAYQHATPSGVLAAVLNAG